MPVLSAGVRASLRGLGPQWFAPVMGLAGIALAWHRAVAIFGPGADWLSASLAMLATLVFACVIVALLVRARIHPRALPEDLAHPVRHGLVAGLPVSLLLLSANALAHGGPPEIVAPVWLLALALQALVTIWVVQRIVVHGLKWTAVTPVMFIPIVGNLVVPLAGTALGFEALSWAFFGIGLFFWPLVSVLVLVRTAQQALPERLLPSWFILISPPAVMGIAASQLGIGAPLQWAALGIALICLGIALGTVRRLGALEFGLMHWSMSFPLAALAALGTQLAANGQLPRIIALGLLVLASLLIFFLLLASWRGLRSGTLLLPEPVATIRLEAADSQGAQT